MSSQSVTSASSDTFLAALWLNGAIFVAELVIFTLVRRRNKAIYEPRTYIPVESKRAKPLPPGIFSWPVHVFKADHFDTIRQNGLDAYVFLRYLRMMIKIFFPIWLLSWAILLPVTSVKAHGGDTGLNMFTFGNIGSDQKPRYAAHIILAYLFTGYILYIIQTEMRHFVSIRQRFLVSPEHAATAQANTVLITGVPLRYLSETALTKLYGHLPGGIAKIWINHDLKELPDLYDARVSACNKLESAELQLIRTAVKLHNKELKTAAKEDKRTNATIEEGDLDLAHSLVPQNKRPTHRLPLGFLPFSLPLIGKKVDSIDWAKEEIINTTKALDQGRELLSREDIRVSSKKSETKLLKYPPLNSVFILFNKQISAHIAVQSLAHHAPYRMSSRYTEVAPADVIWENLGKNPYEIKVRTALSYAATGALIIFWAIPVAFIGIISAIVANCSESWLKWLCTLPGQVQGIIQGVLPPVLLAVLNLLLPIILRLFARFEGIPRRTGLELSLMTRFFIFQVIHNFLILTISSSVFQTLQSLINSPADAPTTLATGLPKGSTFFMTYILLQGLTGSAAGFLQLVPLIVYYAKLYILGSTPRSIYTIKYELRDVAWGTLFPSMSLITVIAIAYMIISPIISGLACVAFFLFYMMWKYLFLWQLEQPASGDTGGLFFPKAIQHTMVGLYLQQVCLAALFFLAKAFPEGILTAVLLVLTAFFHMILNNGFTPLLHPLPLTFADRSYGMGTDDDISVEEKDGLNGATEDKVASQSRTGRDGSSDFGDNADKTKLATDAGPHAPNAYGASVPTEGKQNDGPTDFNHPATVEPQRIIWLPRDTLGVAESEVASLQASDIEASTQNATLDSKGHTEIEGPPPGMEPDAI